MKKYKPIRRYEAVDPNPVTLPVKFQRPPTLAEQIARFMGAHERYVAQQGQESPDEVDDFEIEDEDAPHSPHELVYDEQLNRELPRFEKEHLDRQRAAFDEKLQTKIREDRQQREMLHRMQQEDKAAKKSSKKAAQPEPSESSDD